jgi:folate-binding protein YgfZ
MSSFFVDLKNFETVLVTGPDAAKFLQGQLSCDVHALADKGLTHGVACNNKGRIFAVFILARHGADFYVLLANGQAKIFISNLQKFVPFYKCSMQILSGLKSIGLSGIEAMDTLKKLHLQIPSSNSISEGAGISVYNLQPDLPQFVLIIAEDIFTAMRSSISSVIQEAPYERWELASILSGHFPFSVEDVDKYTPQELHFDEKGYVSFSKGCYTGQEIIARMHYRGKMKKRLYLLHIANFIKHESGIEILDDNGTNLGAPIKQIADSQTRTLIAIASLPAGLSAANLRTKEGQLISYNTLTPDVKLDA